MTIRENIIALRKLYDVTQEELASIAGVTRGAVSQWEGGFSEPRMGAIQKMADHFRISKSNIIEDGGMRLIDPVTKRPRSAIPFNVLPVTDTDMVAVPLRGRVHAGPAIEPECLDELGETVMIPRFLLEADPDSYACEAEGDCMDKVYPNGCIVIISPNRQPQNGSVAVVTIDGNYTVMRRMYRTANTLILSPDSHNPKHKDIVISLDDDHTVTSGGKVVWFQSREEME